MNGVGKLLASRLKRWTGSLDGRDSLSRSFPRCAGIAPNRSCSEAGRKPSTPVGLQWARVGRFRLDREVMRTQNRTRSGDHGSKNRGGEMRAPGASGR